MAKRSSPNSISTRLDEIVSFASSYDEEVLKVLPLLLRITERCQHPGDKQCAHAKVLHDAINSIVNTASEIHRYDICKHIILAITDDFHRSTITKRQYSVFFHCMTMECEFDSLFKFFSSSVCSDHRDTIMEQLRANDPAFNAAIFHTIESKCLEKNVARFISDIPDALFMALSVYCGDNKAIRDYYTKMMDVYGHADEIIDADPSYAPIPAIYPIFINGCTSSYKSLGLINISRGIDDRFIYIRITEMGHEHANIKLIIKPFVFPAAPHDRFDLFDVVKILNMLGDSEIKNVTLTISARNKKTDIAICSMCVFDTIYIFSLDSKFIL